MNTSYSEKIRKNSREETIKKLKEKFSMAELESKRNEILNIISNNENFPYQLQIILNDIELALEI